MTPEPSTTIWLQYTHLEKLYGYLPGLQAVLPDIFGLTPGEYAATRASFDLAARQAAEELLADARTACLVDALPFKAGQRILAVGDSITDDWQSWAEVLRHVCELRHGPEAITVTNAGLSAHTSAMVLRRWPASLASNPDWVICALGGNDVTRVGPDASKTQVSLHESVANLKEMRRIASALSDCQWVWMTPVPVDEDRVRAYPPFQYGLSSWHNADIAALAEAIKGFEDPVIDLVEVFGVPAQPNLQGPDGLHASLDGQKAIVRALLRQLGSDGGPRSQQ